MKKMLMLLGVLALAVTAAAQQHINFADMPLAYMPSPMPNGYAQLNWTNIFYVEPYQWAGAGPGYRHGPVGQDVTFIGGKICRHLQEACYGTISSMGGPTAFQLVSASVAGGFDATYVIATAYNNGKFVGSISFPLGTGMRTLNFPASWGSVTQLVLQTSDGGDLVLYELQIYRLGG